MIYYNIITYTYHITIIMIIMIIIQMHTRAQADKDSIVMIQGFNWESWRAGGGDWCPMV